MSLAYLTADNEYVGYSDSKYSVAVVFQVKTWRRKYLIGAKKYESYLSCQAHKKISGAKNHVGA